MNSSFSLFQSHEDYEVMSWEKQTWGDFFLYAEDCKILLFGEVLSFDQLFQREDSRLLGKKTLVVWQERCLNGDGL